MPLKGHTVMLKASSKWKPRSHASVKFRSDGHRPSLSGHRGNFDRPVRRSFKSRSKSLCDVIPRPPRFLFTSRESSRSFSQTDPQTVSCYFFSRIRIISLCRSKIGVSSEWHLCVGRCRSLSRGLLREEKLKTNGTKIIVVSIFWLSVQGLNRKVKTANIYANSYSFIEKRWLEWRFVSSLLYLYTVIMNYARLATNDSK